MQKGNRARKASMLAYYRKKKPSCCLDHTYSKKYSSTASRIKHRTVNLAITPSHANVRVPFPIFEPQTDERIVIESMVYDVSEHAISIEDYNENESEFSCNKEMEINESGANKSIDSCKDNEWNNFSLMSQEEYDKINAHELKTENVPCQDQSIIEGNRIVNLGYFAELSMELQYKHSQKCTLGLLKLYEEKHKGLVSTFIFRCNVCSHQIQCSIQKVNFN